MQQIVVSNQQNGVLHQQHFIQSYPQYHHSWDCRKPDGILSGILSGIESQKSYLEVEKRGWGVFLAEGQHWGLYQQFRPPGEYMNFVSGSSPVTRVTRRNHSIHTSTAIRYATFVAIGSPNGRRTIFNR